MPIQQMFLGLGAAEKFAEATGGTVTTIGDYKLHTFTSSGTFTVTQLPTTNEFEILTVAGGASSSSNTYTTGGGGGGPVNNQTAQALTEAAYTITVGAGGAQISFNAFGALGNHGSDSSVKLASNNSIIVESDISDLTNGDDSQVHGDGTTATRHQGGASFKVVNGTTTQYTGGSGASANAGGGGAGAGSNGNVPPSLNTAGTGGDGFATTITGSSTHLGGGGGGGSYVSSNASLQSAGGAGGGGTGAGFGAAATSGSANTGGGGGGTKSGYFGGGNYQGGAGGSGIVYIKYKYQ